MRAWKARPYDHWGRETYFWDRTDSLTWVAWVVWVASHLFPELDGLGKLRGQACAVAHLGRSGQNRSDTQQNNL